MTDHLQESCVIHVGRERVNDMEEDKTSVLPFFRWHRGGMKESLNTAVHVKNMDDLKTVLSQSMLMTEDTNIKVQYYSYDDRLALHTYVVLVNGYITGFISNDKYEWQEESMVLDPDTLAEQIYIKYTTQGIYIPERQIKEIILMTLSHLENSGLIDVDDAEGE